MAGNAYLTVAGQKQGAITGPVAEKGKEGSILVHAFDNQILSPRDPTSGLPTGKRQHVPIVILKEIDKSSVPLWNALVNNENLTTWVLRFWSQAANGVMQQIYSITLTNASIASIEEYMLDNTVAANASLPLYERITFTYQKIQWVWAAGPLAAQDDWAPPVA
jgi:type VI secretion system secreted protein Hcp